MRSTALVTIAAVLCFCLASPVTATVDAQGRGRGAAKAGKADKPGKGADKSDKAQQQAGKSDKRKDKDADVIVVDRDGHARVIREVRGTGSLPPGLAKRDQLPPGLQRQLVERGELPPGLRRYLVDVPPGWQPRLPAVPSYYNRYFAGDDLIVVDTRTNRVVAIVRDVLR